MTVELIKAGVSVGDFKTCSDFMVSGANITTQQNIILELINAGYKSADLKICFEFLKVLGKKSDLHSLATRLMKVGIK